MSIVNKGDRSKSRRCNSSSLDALINFSQKTDCEKLLARSYASYACISLSAYLASARMPLYTSCQRSYTFHAQHLKDRKIERSFTSENVLPRPSSYRIAPVVLVHWSDLSLSLDTSLCSASVREEVIHEHKKRTNLDSGHSAPCFWITDRRTGES